MRGRGKCVLQISAKPSWATSKGPGFIRGLHLMQGLTVKGARPADRLTLDGHFPREPGLVTTGVYTDRDHLGLATRAPGCALPGPGPGAAVGSWAVAPIAPPAGRARATP